jgi:hypothetical protein
MTEQTLRIERQSQTGRWIEVEPDEAERLIDLAASMDQSRGGGKWLPVTREQLLVGLSRGAEPRTGTDWYQHIRSAEVAEARLAAAPSIREMGEMEDRANDDEIRFDAD